jgi:transposase
MKEHIIRLTDEVRQLLRGLVRSGTRSVRVVRRAHTLLKSDEGLTDAQIADEVGCTERTVREVRKRFCLHGLERAVYDAPRPGSPPLFTQKQQQRVIALACSDPPQGRVRWTLELLSEQAAKQGLVAAVSKSEVSLWLREHDLKPWRKKTGACRS